MDHVGLVVVAARDQYRAVVLGLGEMMVMTAPPLHGVRCVQTPDAAARGSAPRDSEVVPRPGVEPGL